MVGVSISFFILPSLLFVSTIPHSPSSFPLGFSVSFRFHHPQRRSMASTAEENVIRFIVPSLSSGNFVFLFLSLLVLDFGEIREGADLSL